ncbi:hypothetical protein F4806DRAFT_465892 [Annulohypoxylon nitens]|nr:hypothetical protein F4806DRAFT_465892 [Annulohypoxylon nitens]
MVAIQATPPSIDKDAPLVDPPPGVQSDFDNPPNGNATMNGIASLSLALTIIAFSVHAFGKTRTKLHIEDYLVIPALGSFIAFHIFVYRITSTTGYFVRGWNLQVKDEAWHLFNIYITTTMYNVTMILLKAAILFQWARIFSPGKRNIFFWLCYSIAGVNAVFYLATILIDLLYCQPIQYHWDPTIPGGHCGNDDLLSPLSAAINVLLDLIILILPQRVIWRLNMSFRKKIGVSLVFLTGLLCIVSASIRLSFAVELLNGGDYAYDASFEVLLGSLEMTFAFLTVSLPGVPKSVVIMSQYTRSSLERVTHTSRGTWRGLFTTLTSRSKSDGNNTYRHAETDERGLLSVAKAHSSDGASSKQLEAASIPMQGLSREVQDNAILRTTRFNVSESFVSDDNALNYRGLVPSQHPWQPLSNKSQAR